MCLLPDTVNSSPLVLHCVGRGAKGRRKNRVLEIQAVVFELVRVGSLMQLVYDENKHLRLETNKQWHVCLLTIGGASYGSSYRGGLLRGAAVYFS